jgi:hypothetical protein
MIASRVETDGMISYFIPYTRAFLPVITLNMDILVKLVEGLRNMNENKLISGNVAHEKVTSRLSISPVETNTTSRSIKW